MNQKAQVTIYDHIELAGEAFFSSLTPAGLYDSGMDETRIHYQLMVAILILMMFCLFTIYWVDRYMGHKYSREIQYVTFSLITIQSSEGEVLPKEEPAYDIIVARRQAKERERRLAHQKLMGTMRPRGLSGVNKEHLPTFFRH